MKRDVVSTPHWSDKSEESCDQLIAKLMSEVERLRAVIESLEKLRECEGASILIPCDNPDFDGPASFVEVTDEWTRWNPRRIIGDNVAECLAKAVKAKEAAEAAGGNKDE